jgi:RimJ/RimL family protein N-acetyltransferase
MMTTFPELSDDLIRIVPFTESHLSRQYIGWLNDPEVVRYSEQRHLRHTLKSCRRYLEAQQVSANYFLAVHVSALADRHVGNLGVSVDIHNRTADLSILIGDKSQWNTGVGTRAWMLTLETLLTRLKFRLVTAGTMEPNQPMIGLMKRSGMNIDGILPRRFLWEGREVGLVMASTHQKNLRGAHARRGS